jgi:putative ABC transport system permease protein
MVDKNFLETYQMKIIQGRDFLSDSASEIKECIINQTALKIFGWEDPIGKKLYDNRYQVVGVVKDFNQNNMHDKIEPYVFVMHSGKVYGENIYSIRVASDNLKTTQQKITGLFEECFPNDAFEFGFLEDSLYENDAYRIWDGVNKTFRFFTVLAIIISAMGLFGLISYTAKRRTKEMGIRKVFGSKPLQIYKMLTMEFIPLLLIAVVLGSLGACVLYRYLPGAYKVPLRPGEFLIAWGLLLIIITATISYQAMQVAFSNPVNSLRSD